LPSGVNDTMRDMMSQIRDVGDGIRGGTYTMTAPVITGGSITGVALSGNTFTNPVITGGSINNTPIGASTANTGAFSTLSATGVTTVQAGTVSAPAITTTGDTNTGIFFPAADTIAFAEGGAEAMRITSGGNLLVGTTNDNARLSVTSSSTNDNFGSLYVANTNATADACIAAFSTATNSTATSNVFIKFGINNYSAGNGQINANGAGAAAFGSFSDKRLKENIVDLPSQLANITALRPVEFDYIEAEGGGHQTGFIAQEIQEIYPDAVGERSDGMLTITGWDKTTARLVKAIQELKAELDSVKAELQTIKGA